MKKINLIFILTLVSATLFAQIPAGYYNGTEGLEEEPLREELRSIISSGHSQNSYNDLHDYYESTDNFGSNKVWDMYSMDENGNASYFFYFNSGQTCGNYAQEGDCYNREHSVPKSWFSEQQPMYADLFIVVPTDGYTNGQRSSLPYGETNSATWTSSNGSKKGSSSYSGYSGTVFEPIDAFKGDFARAYFYTATRYKNQISSWGGANFDGNNLSDWTIEMLLEWDNLDPVSQKEIDRNNAVYNIQDNRNPYIDHPEWVQCVFGGGCSGLQFTSSPLLEVMETITYTYNISYNAETEDETLECTTKPDWLTFTTDEANNTAILTGTPTTAGSYDVLLTLSEDGSDSQEQSFTIDVIPYAVTQNIVDVDFLDCLPATWLIYNAAGDHDWQCESEAMEVNAYGSDVACDDWLISSSIDLDSYENEILTFDSYNEYDDDGITSPEMKLKYSTDYTGTGNPESATWTNLTYEYQTINTPVFTSSGDVNLSEISGASVYLAYHYTSSGTGAASSTSWKVDNVLIVGDIIEGISNLDNIETNLFPNPTNGNTVFEYNLRESTNVEIVIYDIVGNKIETVEQNYKKAGNFSNNLNLENYKSGIYFISIKTDYSNNIQKLIKN